MEHYYTMYLDRKVTVWFRDVYDDGEIDFETLLDDHDTDQGFVERHTLFETIEPVCNEQGEEIIEIISSKNDITLYATKSP